jgi:hypothetical protein
MKIPQQHLGEWARELIDECEASRKSRAAQAAMWKSYFFSGSSDASAPATYNKINNHLERLSSYLYGPTDVRFAIEYDKTKSDDSRAMADVASSYLSREFHRSNTDIKFGTGVLWALVKGSTFLKQIWGPFGVDPYIVMPEMMGVLREDLNGLDRQEAFFHSTYMTPGQLERQLTGHPEEAAIMAALDGEASPASEDPSRDDLFKQIVIASTHPVSTTPVNNPAGGIVDWAGGPGAELSPKTLASLIRFDELWVLDSERHDWTTIQIAGDSTVIEGKLQRRNICNVPQHHPFTQICPNEVEGYFWGRSEIAIIVLLQEAITQRFDGITRLMNKQVDPDRAFIGFSGMNDERKTVLDTEGWMAEENPNAKIQELAPTMPANIFESLSSLEEMFDRTAGLEAILRGQGQPGVRAGVHAEQLVKTASPVVRDRAILVERQCEDAGDTHLRLIQAQEATAFLTHKKNSPDMNKKNGKGGQEDEPTEFLMSQLPDDFRVVVDSHSSSPAFSEEAIHLAFNLKKAGSISGTDLIRLTHPPREDSLIAEAEKRDAAQAALVREHPEIAFKGGRKH